MLKIHAQELGGTALLCLQGRIIAGETNALSRAVQSKSDVKAVVLDLDQVIGIDAAGLGLLLELREWTQEKGIKLRLMNVSGRVKQVLGITRLDSVFEISSGAEVPFLKRSGRPDSEVAVVRCGQAIRNRLTMIATGNSCRSSVPSF